MMLQREKPIPVWGFGNPGSLVTVSIGENSQTVTVDASGKWMIHLASMPAGGPHELIVFEGKKEVIKITDVLLGDVWFAGGQSNMEWQVQQSMNASEEIRNANYPEIRLFQVGHAKKLTPQNDIADGSWQVCDSNSVKSASAVAYFFARKLNQDLKVPIGILQSTWGGTPVEAWTSREMLLSSLISHDRILQNDTVSYAHFAKDSSDLVRFWEIVYQPQNNADKIYSKPNFRDQNWPELRMPSTFKDWGWEYYEGIVWMRKTVEIPGNMTGKDLTIELGLPEMNYSLYFNGNEICKTVWNAQKSHRYTIPKKMIKTGKNVISVRFSVLWGGGGFNTSADQMYLTDGSNKLSLAGSWKYQKDLEPRVPKLNHYHVFPTYLFNGMIHPVIPFGIKGFIWYQGENNASAAQDYQTLFPMMITDWRMRWQQGYLPFLFVQLANYMKAQPEPVASDWAELREAQTMTLAQPNTGMACIIDIGEADDIHPKNKQEVGRRLGLLAENLVYGRDITASGPQFQSYQIIDNRVIIQFTNTAKALVSRDGQVVKGFALAGEDHVFHWAQAEISGNQVIIKSEKVQNPVAVRYAWADNPDCTLINSEGLPAIPFRTDDWEE